MKKSVTVAVSDLEASLQAAYEMGRADREAELDRMLADHLRQKQLHELNGTTEVFKHAWTESQHPRDKGKFATKPGAANSPDSSGLSALSGESENPTRISGISPDSPDMSALSAIPEDHLLEGLHADVPAGLWATVRDKVLTAAAKVHERLVLATPALLKLQHVLGLIGDTPEDLTRFGYKPVTSGVAGHDTPDALRDATGVGGTLGARLAAHVLAKTLSWIRTSAATGKAVDTMEGDPYLEAGEAIADVLAILADEFGLDGGLPTGEDVGLALVAMEDAKPAIEETDAAPEAAPAPPVAPPPRS